MDNKLNKRIKIIENLTNLLEPITIYYHLPFRLQSVEILTCMLLEMSSLGIFGTKTFLASHANQKHFTLQNFL